MLVLENLNFNLIGQAKLELSHKYCGTYGVKDGSQVYETTKMTCTCNNYECRHQQAVKEAETERLKDTGVVPWYRLKGKALRAIAKESQESYFNGVYLDPEIEF